MYVNAQNIIDSSVNMEVLKRQKCSTSTIIWLLWMLGIVVNTATETKICWW